ncbi:hypothetical protein IG631_08872 [Alternaria alternata]|nr:hypothetical protein IG631_08872 [Alternaria alternata]
MESECDGLKWQADDYCTYNLRLEFPLQVFDLFIQWLYTRKYQEKEGLAWSFDTCLTLLSAPLEIDVAPRLRVDWPIKAAIASWELGATLHAKNFQNYAIKRLFEAFSRPLSSHWHQHCSPMSSNSTRRALRKADHSCNNLSRMFSFATGGTLLSSNTRTKDYGHSSSAYALAFARTSSPQQSTR